MGAPEVSLSVLAFTSPLTTAWGYLPFVIYFAGLGAPVTFIVAAVILAVFSVGYLRMSKHSPNPGAFYSLIAIGLSKPLGLGSAFLATFGYLLLNTGVYAFLGIVVSDTVTSLGGPQISWQWVALFGIALVGVVGYIGIEFAAKTLVVIMSIEIVVVTVFIAAVLFQGGADGISFKPWSLSAFFDGQVGLGIMYAMVMFIGFEATAIYREEAKNPDKTVPRATGVAVAFIGIFNAVATWMLINAVGPDNAVQLSTDDPAHMFPNGYSEFVGTTAKDIASILVIVGVLACTLAIHNVFARYLYNLGVDHALPRALGKAHPKMGSPHNASVSATALSLVLIMAVIITGTDPSAFYGSVAGIGSLCVLFLMVLTSVAVPVYFWKYRTPGGSGSLWAEFVAPSIAAVILAIIVGMALFNATDFLVATPAMSAIFIAGITAVFLAGVAVAIRLKKTRPDSYLRIGRQAG